MLALGCVHIPAAVRNLLFRGLALSIVTMFVGLVTVLTMFCFPTALALVIYGSIIYLNEDVTLDFPLHLLLCLRGGWHLYHQVLHDECTFGKRCDSGGYVKNGQRHGQDTQ